jgi:hypothetical protein
MNMVPRALRVILIFGFSISLTLPLLSSDYAPGLAIGQAEGACSDPSHRCGRSACAAAALIAWTGAADAGVAGVAGAAAAAADDTACGSRGAAWTGIAS